MAIAQTAARDLEAPKLSNVLSIACLLLAIAMPVFLLWYLAVTPAQAITGQLGIAESLPADAQVLEFDFLQRLVVIMIGSVPVTCMSFGLLRARRCFQSFSRGDYFSLNVVQGLRGLAAGIFYSIVGGFIVTPVLSVFLTSGRGEGKHALAINFDSRELLALVFAGLVWQIATVMSRANALAEENSQFV